MSYSENKWREAAETAFWIVIDILIIAALFGWGGCSGCDTNLERYCPEGAACWPSTGTELPLEALQGECFAGNVECSEEGIQCVGARLPEPEECDGLDNDCDGEEDEGFYPLDPFDLRNDCNLCGVCALAEKVCAGGQWQCVPLLGPTDETCNGLDDDCNCEPDDGITTGYFYPEEEHPNTVGVGECTPEVRRCEDGTLRVTPATLPVDEVCDGLDNDCDGVTDEDLAADPGAFLLAIDVSSSMTTEIDAVTAAVCDFSIGAENGSRFAVVEFARGISPSYVTLLQDFADATETCATLLSMAVGGNGAEYALEAILVGDGLVWPDLSDRTTVVFTDESLQIPFPESVNLVEDDCTTIGYELAVISPPIYHGGWSDLLWTCGGFAAPLYTDRIVLTQFLLETFFGNCR